MALDNHELTVSALSPILAVSGQRLGQSVHLHVRGELDMWSTRVLEEWLLEAERETGDIVVDLQSVTFIDASGVHAFQRAADRAFSAGRGLTLRNAPRIVRRVLELTHSMHLLVPGPSAVASTTLERPGLGLLARETVVPS